MEMQKGSCWVRLLLVYFLFCLAESKDVKQLKSSPETEINADDSGDGLSNSAYSEWSEWSKCSRQCKQFRTRHCLNPSMCESRTQKLFRACHSSKCRNKLLVMANPGKPDERPSKSRIMLHLQQYIYSEWSQWSPCSKSCHTKRTRACKFPEICGKNSVQEDYKSCYKEGDICEKLYLESLQHLPQGVNSTSEDSAAAHPLDNIKCGISEVTPDKRIIGGRRAFKDAWPWQVLILNRFREPFCGGVILAPSWVLTAAHCVRRRLKVRAGEYDLSEIEGSEQEERVEASFVYPDYDPDTVDNDLALLKLRAPFLLNRHVQPVCLPEPDDELPLFARATILGWGKRRNEASFGTDVLHQAEVPVVPAEECRDSYDDYYISENMLCAGFDRGRVDSCSGDSGGPLLHKNEKDGPWTVYGVTSFGDGCGETGKYGVYASVASSLGWIRHITGMNW